MQATGAGGGRTTGSGPDARNLVVDLVRAAAIVVVMVGHWLMAAFHVGPDGSLHRGDILGLSPWAHPLTWVLQVMPLFFVVGGFANALSWRHATLRAEPYGAWLRRRMRRLLAPLLPLMLLWVVVAPAAVAAGVSPHTLRLLTRASLVPTWFLAWYVVVVALVPWTLVLWDRLGWGSIVLGVAASSVVDVVSFATDRPLIGAVNLFFVWGTLHQLGYAWLDGALGGTARRLGLVAAGLSGTMLLVGLGPYAVSMVGVEGFGANNTYPPRVTLALLGVAQAGLATAAEPWLARLATGARVLRMVRALNLRMMTLYLWHLTAVTFLVALSSSWGGLGLQAQPGSVAWWWSRPLWCLALAALTVPPLLLFGRFETPRPDPRPAPPAAAPVLAMLASGLAVAWLADRGLVSADGRVSWWVLLVPPVACFGLGVFAVPTLRSPRIA